VLQAFQLIHHEESGLYWNTASAILMLVFGAVALAIWIAPYLPESLRRPFKIEGRDELVNRHEWFGAMFLLGLAFVAFGVGFFLRDLGYFLIVIAVTAAYWQFRVRPSRRRGLERNDAKPG
jgi:hypothetical protein